MSRSGNQLIANKDLKNMDTSIPKQNISIQSIPAIIWGLPSDSVFIFVHGKMSQKEEAERFVKVANRKGYQVISFDLPEHGERKTEDYKCTVQNAVHDLRIIGKFTADKWSNVSLFGSSIGAFFCLVAYSEMPFGKCLFLSPILDMENLIQRMMGWFEITDELLRERNEIPTPMGETLSWTYYQFVRENPIVKWESPTFIMYGANDNLTTRDTLDDFVEKFKCNVEIFQAGEHFFHTEEQCKAFDRWLNMCL